MENNVNPRVLNEVFLQKIASPAGIAEFETEATGFVRKKLRESAFVRKILPPQYVSKAELHPSILHDGVVKIVDIEPDSKAMALNFRGDADYTYVEGERYEIPFFEISSENYQKTEQELLAYNIPITDVINKNSVLDIHEQEDTKFIAAVDAAIQSNAAGAKAITGTYDVDGTIKRADFKALFDLLDGDKLLTSTLLMDATMFNRLSLYPATNVGDQFATEVTMNGFTLTNFMGRNLVVTNKKELLGTNGDTIYAFTTPEFLGEFCILDDIKFWLKKEKSLITFANYETIGIGIGNNKAMAKLTLA